MTDIVKVFVEETNSFVSLKLTKDQLDRASRDNDYLQELVNTETSRSSEVLEASAQSEAEPCEVEDNSGKSLYVWTGPCVQLLLTLYEEIQDEFTSGTRRHKSIWQDIANKMQEKNPAYKMTGGQCQSKLAGLKKTFKKIIDHNNKSGNDKMTWPYFDRMNEIFGSTGWAQPKALASEAGPTPPTSILEKPTKKRKLDVLVENFFKNSKEERNMKEEEKERQRKDRKKIKEEQYNRLLQMKERQHAEKMQLLKEVVHSLKK